MPDRLAARIAHHLEVLTAHPDRRVGGPGNRAATSFFADRAAACGLAVARRSFECLDWEAGEVVLTAAGERFVAHPGPYSLPCSVVAPLTRASTMEDLETDAVRGTVVLLHGEIARGQLMPKNFTFYNPEGHKRIIRALETHAPAAVLAATGRDPQMVGRQYPFPLIEDGDFDIPSAYMKDVDGDRLLAHVGSEIALSIASRRLSTTAEHILATKQGAGPGRIVLFAHIDSRAGSPGALDNASGVTALLGLAELLTDYAGGPTVELAPLNGEDNYANPGELHWLAENQGRFDDILLGINIDDAGRRGQQTQGSFYGCPPELEQPVRDLMAGRAGFGEGPQWFQGDHMLFGLHERPAIAIASSDMAGFMAEFAHTPRDTADLADPFAIAGIARFLRDLVAAITCLG